MRISDWSSDVCSSDLRALLAQLGFLRRTRGMRDDRIGVEIECAQTGVDGRVGGDVAILGKVGVIDRTDECRQPRGDRKSGVEGRSVSVRVDLGGRGILQKKKPKNLQQRRNF